VFVCSFFALPQLYQLGICILVDPPHGVGVMFPQSIDHLIVATLRTFVVGTGAPNGLLDLIVIVVIVGLVALVDPSPSGERPA
jgi:hypothetical protein